MATASAARRAASSSAATSRCADASPGAASSAATSTAAPTTRQRSDQPGVLFNGERADTVSYQDIVVAVPPPLAGPAMRRLAEVYLALYSPKGASCDELYDAMRNSPVPATVWPGNSLSR